MKLAQLLVLGIALAAGGTAAYFASGNRQPEPPKAPPVVQLETAEVLVAKVDLSRGHVIGDNDIGWQTYTAASSGSFIKKTDRPDAIKDFVGATVRTPLAVGEPIQATRVVMTKGGGFMAAALTPGMRAVMVDISPESGIMPEDHIDVILTRHDKVEEKQTGVEKYLSKTILRNAQVLAVNQKSAAIEVTPKQAEMLANSRQMGTLSLELRSLVGSESSTPEAEENDTSSGWIALVRYGTTTWAKTD